MMRWIGRVVAVLAALFSAAACDSSGRPYEDLRLAQLRAGVSTEQDVINLFGTPATVRSLEGGGRGLVYPLGPEGAHTLLIRIGADGRYAEREDLLSHANFARVGAGMGADEVIALLGPPGRKQPLVLKQQVAWEWRFLDGHETRMFVVMFDTAGRVVGSAIEDDPRRQGGG